MVFARSVVDYLVDKKAEDVILLDIRSAFPFADYFVVCTGTSERMLNALAKSIDEMVHNEFKINGRIEGTAQDGWILIDFGDIIVHILSPEQREFYGLESVWNETKIILRVQ